MRGDPVSRRSCLLDLEVEDTVGLHRTGSGVSGHHHTGCAGGYRSFLGHRRGQEERRMQVLRIPLDIVSFIVLVQGINSYLAGRSRRDLTMVDPGRS